uniref:Serine hydrolase domain-containing protein n=1 Tax=Haptolina brevifila TaxID=156173 RepID=A0A7S2BPY5_9EUKA|eukprot:CAMPEP_0174723872 /NCGR_PEP_ID=MMETSP1094-20130205/42126_1 /TAXON_ID=156173 /ORGANISM="Chrysochromulina brevifilum, Strain UTEX LB 985" /LENGTH=345 /DNA_ID=CAMNT_0015924991 /DNA_START=22 /DNA_END=1059 /DNA_ORIENTATION=+
MTAAKPMTEVAQTTGAPASVLPMEQEASEAPAAEPPVPVPPPPMLLKRPIIDVASTRAAGFIVQDILTPSEFEHQRMLKGTRYPCAPPPEQCLQPERYEGYCTMEGKEARAPTAYPMKSLKTRRPHVVMLHGTACNSGVLKVQLRKLIDKMSNSFDLTFIQGSRMITNTFHPTMREIKTAFGEQTRDWYREYLETSPIDRDAKIYGSFDWGLAKFEKEIQELHRPVDALIGFSQGALFATLVAARALHRKDAIKPLRCVVLLNPPNPEALSVRAPDFFKEPLGTPALISKGLADEVVPGGPEAYKPLYNTHEWVEHSGPHQPMPGQNEEDEQFADKIVAFMKKCC